MALALWCVVSESPRDRCTATSHRVIAIGTMPDVTAITAAAHDAGAKVVVDGVHLTPHVPT